MNRELITRALQLTAGAALIAGLLIGCNAAQQQLAADLAPAVLNAVPGATPYLTDAAKVACDIEAIANTAPPSSAVSQIQVKAGSGCNW